MKKSALEIYCEAVLDDFPSLKPIIDNILVLAKAEYGPKPVVPEIKAPKTEKTLKDFGYAPGNYMIRCACVPVDANPIDWPLAAKGAWRCQSCAQHCLDAYNASARTPVDPAL